jgi:hypothetical protein
VIIAGKIREHEAPVVFDADKARFTTAMGNVRALGYGVPPLRVGAGDE